MATSIIIFRAAAAAAAATEAASNGDSKVKSSAGKQLLKQQAGRFITIINASRARWEQTAAPNRIMPKGRAAQIKAKRSGRMNTGGCRRPQRGVGIEHGIIEISPAKTSSNSTTAVATMEKYKYRSPRRVNNV